MAHCTPLVDKDFHDLKVFMDFYHFFAMGYNNLLLNAAYNEESQQ
jgi:hypothetical protein